MLSQSNVKLDILFIFLLPIVGCISFFKSGNITKYASPFFFFLVFFGVFFVVPTSGDAYRHYQEFRDFSFIDFNEFWDEFIKILNFKSMTESDIYAYSSKFILSPETS